MSVLGGGGRGSPRNLYSHLITFFREIDRIYFLRKGAEEEVTSARLGSFRKELRKGFLKNALSHLILSKGTEEEVTIALV